VEQLRRVVDQRAVKQFVRRLRIQRSMIEFVRGTCTAVRTTRIPTSARIVSDSAGYVPPRSRWNEQGGPGNRRPDGPSRGCERPGCARRRSGAGWRRGCECGGWRVRWRLYEQPSSNQDHGKLL
jgi:hypothetical protein